MTTRLTTVPDSPQAYVHIPPARSCSKLPATPTTGKQNVWLSGLLSTPSFPFTSDVSSRHTGSVVGEELGCNIRPRTSSILEHVSPIPWMALCVCTRPNASTALDTAACKLCCGLPPQPEPEPGLGFHERNSERKDPLIRASKAILQYCEPSRDFPGLG